MVKISALVLSILIFISILAIGLIASAVSLVSSSSVSRTIFPNEIPICSNTNVTLNVTVTPGDTFYIIDERFPSSWSIINPGSGNTQQAGHIKWSVLSGATSTSYSYLINSSCTPGTYNFGGEYGFDDTIVHNITGQTEAIIYEPSKSDTAIKWNNVPLIDSTVYDKTSNTCTASRLGMNIQISPCQAYDVDSRDIEQNLKFTWNGTQQINISWVFVYDNDLEKGEVFLWKNRSYTYSEDIIVNKYITNYLIDNVVSYVNLTEKPNECDLGNLNNTQFYDVTRSNENGTYVQTICFTSRTVVNATTFRISGNYDGTDLVTKTGYKFQYVDVTNKINTGHKLLNDNRVYYANSIEFSPDETLDTLWKFTPANRSKSGKWHILGYATDEGLTNALTNNHYIYIDPWWSSSWGRKKQLNITGGATELYNFTVYVNFTYDSDMQTDFDDIRFLNGAEDTELVYELDYKTDSTSAGFWILVPNLTTGTNVFYMYYNNPSVASTSDGVNAWDINYVAVFHFSECTGTVTKDSKGTHNGTLTGGIAWNATSLYGCGILNDKNNAKYVNTSHSADLNVNNPSTIEYVLNAYQTLGTNYGGLGKGGYTVGGWELLYSGGGNAYAVYANSIPGSSSGNPTYFAWNYMYMKNNGTVYLYRDGIQRAKDPLSGSVTTTRGMYMGARDPGIANNAGINGTFDEVRISNVFRSDPWLNRSMDNSGKNLFIFGPEQEKPGDNPPNVTLTLPTNGFNASTNTLNFNATFGDDWNLQNATLYIWNSTDAEINSTFVDIKGVLNYSSIQVVLPRDDTYHWNYKAYDNASNFSYATNNFTVTTDTVFPSLSIIFPTEGSVYNFNVTQLNFSAYDLHIKNCTFSDNGLINRTINCAANLTGLNASEGVNNWALSVTDYSGNTNNSNITFTQNTLAPLVTITYPQNAIYTTYNFNFTAFTNEILFNAWYSLNGAANVSANFSNSSISSCYQESANVSTACGGLDTGNYFNLGGANMFNSQNIYDENWNTFGYSTTSSQWMFINYTKPLDMQNTIQNFVLWQVKDQSGMTNLTIPLSCWNKFPDKIALAVVSTDVAGTYGVSWSCQNTTSDWPNFRTLRSNTGAISSLKYVYEEAIIWRSNNNITNNFTAAEGTNTLFVYGNDTGGLIGYDNVTFNVDTLIPEVQILFPSNGSIYYNISGLNFTANDTNLQACVFGNVTINRTISCTENLTGLNASYGANTWFIYVNDSAGNTNYSRVDFTKQDMIPIRTNQTPYDIDTRNAVTTGVNISFNFTLDSYDFNLSTIYLYHKVNSSISPYCGFLNGTANDCNYISMASNYNVSLEYFFLLNDNSIYPADYNYNETQLEDLPKLDFNLSDLNSLIKVNFINFTNYTYGIFEVNVRNATAGASPLEVYYCNSTYSTGSPDTSSDCITIGTLLTTDVPDHVESPNSSHYVLPFTINATTELINNVIQATPTSNFILRGNIGTWSVKYIENVSRIDAIQNSSDLGTTWDNFTGTVDSHIHQFNGNDTFFYYGNIQDYSGNNFTSIVYEDLLQLGGLPPTPPTIIFPINLVYNGIVPINYTASISPNQYAISYYNISLFNPDGSFNSTVRDNNGLNLSYIWNVSAFFNSTFIIGVKATDAINQTSLYGLSSNFTINNTLILTNVNLSYPTNDSMVNTTSVEFSCYAQFRPANGSLSLILDDVVNFTNSTSIMNTELNISLNFTVAGVSEGIHNWSCFANNTINEPYSKYTDTWIFTVDTTIPIVNLTTYTVYTQKFVTANFTVNETYLKSINISVDGLTLSFSNSTFVNTTPFSNPFNYAVNFTNLSEGNYTVTGLAMDRAGNTAQDMENVTIDGDTPRVTLQPPTPAYFSLLPFIEVNVTVVDFRFRNVTVYITNSTGGVINITTSTSSSFDQKYYVPDGDYTVNASARDFGNLVGWSENRSIHKEYNSIGIGVCRGVLNASGNYHLTGDIVANDTTVTGSACLILEYPNTNLDCQGHNITINANKTAVVINRTGTLVNCRIKVGENATSVRVAKLGIASITNVNISSLVGLEVDGGYASATNLNVRSDYYGIWVHNGGRITLTNGNINACQYGIFINNSNASTFNNVAFTNFSDGNYNTDDLIRLINSNRNTFYNFIAAAVADSANDGLIKYVNSSNNAMYYSNFTTPESILINLTLSSTNNTFRDVRYDNSTERVDSTSSLTRSWTTTVTVVDQALDPIRGSTVHYTDSQGQNRTGTTNSRGEVISEEVDYTNVYGVVGGKNPYELVASYQSLTGENQTAQITAPYNTTLKLNNDINSTPMSRTAMRILLGIILLVGLAASTGFFIVKMRNGDSVIDVWKYFVIMLIFLVIFLVLFLVLSGYIMEFLYPRVPN